MIGPFSRYASCILYVDGKQEFLGIRPRIDTTPQPDDIFHTVQDGDRIDLIACRYLGRPDLWWVICDYNDLFFPPELPVGMVVRVPSPERVEMRIVG